MATIDRNPKDLKLVNKCDMCKCTLPKHHPHHWLCGKCWEKKQMELGRIGYVTMNYRRDMLKRGKRV